jgi:hypothetical protein
VLVLLLSFVYMFTYDAVGAPLGLTMLSYGLLWKSNIGRELPSGRGRGRRPGQAGREHGLVTAR